MSERIDIVAEGLDSVERGELHNPYEPMLHFNIKTEDGPVRIEIGLNELPALFKGVRECMTVHEFHRFIDAVNLQEWPSA